MNNSYSRRMTATFSLGRSPLKEGGAGLAVSSLVVAVALGRQCQIGELVGEGLAVAATVTEPEVAKVAVAREPQLLCELGLVEQPHLLRGGTGDRLGRLDLQAAVAAETRGRRDQLPDDHVLLQAEQAVGLALERRIREDLGGLLERGGRQERVRSQRRLGDTEDDLLDRRLLLLRLVEL